MQQLTPNGSILTRLQTCLALVLVGGLAGCGGGGDGVDDASADAGNVSDATIQSIKLSGSVGDGPIVGATVTIKDAKGKLLNSSVSDASANYSINIKAPGNAYPITLEATGGIDIVTNSSPDFTLISAALHPSHKHANLNPYSTLIINTARSMPGGLTQNNVERANQTILNQLNFGLDTFSMPNPISTPVTGDNVALIVKASETFGEMIRRTRDILISQGANIDGDDVLNALASDLVDGVVDGSGGNLADARIAVLSNLTAAQVLVEAMSNSLKVHGADATQAMDASIKQIMPAAPAEAVTANVRVTEQSLIQARTAIKAAQILAPSAALSTIATMLETIQPGASAAEVANMMPGDTSTDLDAAIQTAAFATADQLATANAVSTAQYGTSGTDNTPTTTDTSTSTDSSTDTSTDTDTSGTTDTGVPTDTNTTPIPVTNTAPTIAGTPATSATVGMSYNFVPTAHDADGDRLTFSIKNKPNWASFDTATGALYGTPNTASVGSSSAISISVSDGTATTSLSQFTLTVLTDPTSRTPLVLYTFEEGSGTTVRDVSGTGSPLNLTIGSGAAVTWNASGSLTIKSPTLIATSSPATKLSNALKASNALTLEAWLKPANTTQAGPARIVSLSQDLNLRNLSLGQEQTSYDMRLRTTTTDTNGRPSKTSAVGTAATALTHLVYTRNSSGFVKMYINGVEQLNSTVGGNFSNWSDAYRLLLGNELSGDRPWLGTLHQVAIYDHAFGAADVDAKYAAGSGDVPVTPEDSGSTDTSTGNGDTTGSVPTNSIPVARDDSTSTTINTAVTIDVLSNDSGLEDAPVTVSVISGPSNGSTSIKSDSSIIYTPASGFYGSDSFTYRVMDSNGDMATAAVTITVTCSTCDVQSNHNITLTWDAVPGEILGYRVYYGNTATNATTFASVTPTNQVTYKSIDDLSLKAGDSVCFRVKSYNSAGESSYSSAVCKVI